MSEHSAPGPSLIQSRVALFGGSFDPIHLGHVAVVDGLLADGGFDTVVVVPTAQQPLREAHRATATQRLEMVRRALAGRQVEVVECEMQRGAPSYTYDTVVELLGRYGRLACVVGSDAAARVGEWYRYRELMELVDWVVIERQGKEGKAVPLSPPLPETTRRLMLATPALSSSQVRHAVVTGDSLEDLVPSPVVDYIRDHALYQVEEAAHRR